jgi:hypothetical protein
MDPAYSSRSVSGEEQRYEHENQTPYPVSNVEQVERQEPAPREVSNAV